jgi:hypothetical protein
MRGQMTHHILLFVCYKSDLKNERDVGNVDSSSCQIYSGSGPDNLGVSRGGVKGKMMNL